MDSPTLHTHASRAVEATFTTSDPSYPFVGISDAAPCRVDLYKMLPRENSRYAEYFRIERTDPDRTMDLADANDRVDPTVLVRHEQGGLFEFVVTGNCPAWDLAEQGAIPHTVSATDGTGRIVTDIPSHYDACEIITNFLDAHPSMELSSKREKESSTPAFTAEDLRHTISDHLTYRQQEVLWTAYEAGYYERPREITGDDLADELGITPATLSQHIRTAERKLLSLLYEERLI